MAAAAVLTCALGLFVGPTVLMAAGGLVASLRGLSSGAHGLLEVILAAAGLALAGALGGATILASVWIFKGQALGRALGVRLMYVWIVVFVLFGLVFGIAIMRPIMTRAFGIAGPRAAISLSIVAISTVGTILYAVLPLSVILLLRNSDARAWLRG